ncbi:succinoglycan biosynthesis protein [Roseobacter sp. AzwK-3b]|jgi:endonuclease YncB( thermonuclease family)|uniref:thermonuclease family protein n=1 Tax=Roseobacter sp. AzwK-3b TaxID=351016 RepID=UPI0001568AFE|nr:thermonuclease family protein [Roseobacter sp. AzwK-3b]EDM71428.1 succinoglycan biosynthesis protein [Roseobacter sp. AzwK-3b]
MPMLQIVAVLALMLSAAPITANELVGVASVIDADTLEIRGVRIRSHGIDAPESQQLCTNPSGQQWGCGQQAAFALSDRIGRRTVNCAVRDVDRYDRAIAVCTQDNQDLNRWLVSEGWAVAYRRYSRDYIGAEDQARRAGYNIWAGQFVMPWEWRRGQRLP